MRFEVANICTWTKEGVGTKVLDPDMILGFLEGEIKAGAVKFDSHGHAFIPCPQLASAVSCGVGLHTNNEADYVLRSYRGKVEAYLCRAKAIDASSVAVVLYTREGYLNDLQVTEEERVRINVTDCEYVIVCVLASAGPETPVSPRRFCANLCGGNLSWADYDREILVRMAAETTLYHDTWCVVSD